MDALRWIFGLPLAIVLTLFFHWIWQSLLGQALYNYTAQHPQISRVINIAEVAITNGLLVFFYCWFIPSSKKYIGLGWILLVFGHGLFLHFNNQVIHDNGIADFLDNFFPAAGLILGFYISYLLFKDKGWGWSPQPN
jgi:hypothetical protein